MIPINNIELPNTTSQALSSDPHRTYKDVLSTAVVYCLLEIVLVDLKAARLPEPSSNPSGVTRDQPNVEQPVCGVRFANRTQHTAAVGFWLESLAECGR